MGKSFHVVSYPVNNESDLNVVIVKKNRGPLGDKKKLENELLNPRLLSVRNQNLTYLLKGVTSWSVWPLYRTGIITRATQIYSRNSLYIGDAGHPLYPHLAQGAALALEDSHTLYKLLHRCRSDKLNISKVFQNFAELRIRRYQRMQVESRLNGYIFQQQGILRFIRNILVKNFGPKIMEKDWIYENRNISRI
jgi:salicylate hydroxylase